MRFGGNFIRFRGEDYRTISGMDEIQQFNDVVNSTSLGQDLALRLQLLPSVPQCFPLLSQRQHFPIPQLPLKQLLGTVFRNYAGLLLWNNSWKQNICCT